ncbi:Troponin I [Clonorchis sinensis]|uniref:Troponin I n=2 Tax=Clonorchis sinensis TaxID=79923 RepID=G7Y343_CLOSI|nr:Troponin I [Clonorchis sinensis]GAA47380.1 troponin I [Clonorchis sinensis]
MPTPSITINPEEEDYLPPKNRPKPLVSLPALSIQTDDADETSDSDEDVMTAEEEAAARRYLSGGGQTEQRRMSSLDVYLAQPQKVAESMIINRRRSMREEEEAVARIQSGELERQEEKARQAKLQKEREEVQRAREAKREHKQNADSQSLSPSPRRMTYRKVGLGGLSKERRKKLKDIIMRKAKEEMQAERMKEMRAREEYLKSVVPSVNIDGLDEKQLRELLGSWHLQAKGLEEQRIELIERIKKQDEEIQELTMKLLDTKGKYPKPILRKVTKKENLLARLEKLRTLNAMHTIKPSCILKSVQRPEASHKKMVNGSLEDDKTSS